MTHSQKATEAVRIYSAPETVEEFRFAIRRRADIGISEMKAPAPQPGVFEILTKIDGFAAKIYDDTIVISW